MLGRATHGSPFTFRRTREGSRSFDIGTKNAGSLPEIAVLVKRKVNVILAEDNR